MIQTIPSDGYFIEIGAIQESSFSEFLDEKYASSKKVIFVDENTQEYCLEYVLTSFEQLAEAEIIAIPAGEENKSLDICVHIWSALTEYGIKRNDVIINLGGGMITDLGGFIASVYLRGIDFINIPTSLLAMVDASAGGKTGIDFEGLKNQLGVFANPQLVVCDPCFFSTLPQDEFLSGKAEMLKHGVIQGRETWDKAKVVTPRNISVEAISRSISVKNAIVLEDFKEKNSRKKLNLGHTIGHALESYFLSRKPVPHGICVAWGLVIEALLALQDKQLSTNDFQEIQHVISSCYPSLKIEEPEIPLIINFLSYDKKNQNSEINFSLIKGFGDVEINHTFNQTAIQQAIKATLC